MGGTGAFVDVSKLKLTPEIKENHYEYLKDMCPLRVEGNLNKSPYIRKYHEEFTVEICKG